MDELDCDRPALCKHADVILQHVKTDIKSLSVYSGIVDLCKMDRLESKSKKSYLTQRRKKAQQILHCKNRGIEIHGTCLAETAIKSIRN
jgi:hypothetical protein